MAGERRIQLVPVTENGLQTLRVEVTLPPVVLTRGAADAEREAEALFSDALEELFLYVAESARRAVA